MAAYQYIYVMKGLSKTYPGGREVLKDIWLSFLPGAKIGVLGPNGAGKSTLLRIMAGEEREFAGEAWASEGARVGYLPQEPALDATKDVFGNVIEGLAATKALVDRFEAVSARFAEDLSEAEMDALVAEQGELQEGIDQAGARDLDRTVEIAKDALHWRRSTSKRAGASESWPVPPPEVHGPRTIAAVMLADGA
jgi:energy-dependent translational throttle protein EttA